MKFKQFSLFVMTLSLVFSMTACSEEPATSTSNAAISNDTSTNETQASNTEYPIVIKHALGETVIESKPERIATISWGNQDSALALGVVPVGFSEANYGVTDDSGLLPWTADKLTELGVDNPVLFKDTDGVDFEAVNDVEPDVILASYSGMTQEEYDLLSEIAPVVTYPNFPWQTYWREQIISNATGMGMQKEGEQLVKDLEALISEKISNYPSIKGKTAAFIYFIPTDFSQFYIYLPVDPRASYLTDLGMEFSEDILNAADDESSFTITVSAENVDLIKDLDIIVAYGDDALLQEIKADSLLGTIPAIQRESVVFMENNTPFAASSTPSALSIPANIDEYLAQLGEAAEKVK